VWRDGQEIPLGWARQRSVLAVLLMDLNRPVSVARIVDAVWGELPPRDARNAVQTNISRLRRVLEPPAGTDQPGVLALTESGYLLSGDPAQVDIAAFDRHLAAAYDLHQSGDLPTAADEVELALDLWRGEPFSGLDGPLINAERQRLAQRRLDASALRTTIMVARGLYSRAITELARLVVDHPLEERLHATLMVALYGSGRRADALAVFEGIRQRLAEELGADPGPVLSESHQRILRADLDVATPADPEPVRAGEDGSAPLPPEPARNDLPTDIGDFTGRQSELARLLATQAGTAKASVVLAIDGMAGVGKSALAVHIAHPLAARYPDAQLFIDLHGHSGSQRPIAPSDALDRLLRALGIPAGRIPDDADARAALWRAELATRSVLVVLDNAADTAHVRPLLPGTSRSLVVITSRRRLIGLETALNVSLDVLPEADAIALFTRIVGDSRTATETAAVREVIDQCGHLPLAIRITAARLRARPAWSVRHLADRLRQARWPLAEFSADDRSVATAFALSYQQLDPDQRRMFRLLGLHPERDLGVPAAAALAGVAASEAERQLESLVDDHLLAQSPAGRYRLHDLIHQHAHTTAMAEESEADRNQALRRMVDHYLHTAYRGSRLLDQPYPPIDIGTATAGCLPTELADDVAATAWFDANHRCVLAASRVAEDMGWDTAVWQLAWTLDNFHYRRHYLRENIAGWLAGLAAAERLGDLAVQGRAHRRLGLVYAPLGKVALALQHLRRALALSEQAGDVLGEAGARFVLATIWSQQGDIEQALAHAVSAHELYRQLGNRAWEVRALSMMGTCHAKLGHHEEARRYVESALALCREQDDVYGQADSLDSLGGIANDTGQPVVALRHYQQAQALWHALEYNARRAGTLEAIGDILSDLNVREQAQQAWQQAIDLYRAQNLHSDADRIDERRAAVLC
jgi:DNA-binding SARP family transcriptional activator/tetratricopeptide (TPR) repeat protein